jgi:hypothetical protein
MPTAQSVMPIHKGMSPGINTANQIPSIQFTQNVVAKTASYTLLPTDSGTLFHTTGATGAVTFTLPAVATSAGLTYTFMNTVDQNMVVAAPTDTMVADGDATATSATWSTTSHKIGGACTVSCDGAKWFLLSCGNLSAVATIA